MNRTIVYLQALLAMVISWCYFLFIDEKKVFVQVNENGVEYNIVLIGNLVLFILSVLLLFEVGRGTKNKNEVNNLKIEENVFIQIIENILRAKKEIEKYHVMFQIIEDSIEITIEVAPKTKETLNFTDFSEKIIEEIKEKIKENTSYQKDIKIQFLFTTKIKK